jgi:hypothetical protein
MITILIITFFTAVLIGIIIFLHYHIVCPLIRRSKENSFLRQIGEPVFASCQIFHNQASEVLEKVYRPLAEKGFNNPLGLFAAALCTTATFLLIIIDISFISLYGAQFWGSNPGIISTEITEATKKVISVAGLTDYFEAILTWAVAHISATPNGHFLAANALITVICLLISGLFLKESIRPSNWLPLNLTLNGRKMLGILCSILLACVVFYYGFLIYYGIASNMAANYETHMEEDYFAKSSATDTQTPIVNSLDKYNDWKLVSGVAYSMAVLGTNFLAFWGMLLFWGIMLALLIGLSRLLLRGFHNFYIVPLAMSLGHMRVEERSQNIQLSQNQNLQLPPSNSDSQPADLSSTGSLPNTQILDQDSESNDHGSNPPDDPDKGEQDRQRDIYDDPLNLE